MLLSLVLFKESNSDMYCLTEGIKTFLISSMFSVLRDDILSICNGSSNAAGYLVKNHMFLTLAEDFERSANLLFETKAHWLFQNDQVWQKYMKNDKWFCFNIHLGYQRKSFSNLANVVVFFGY